LTEESPKEQAARDQRLPFWVMVNRAADLSRRHLIGGAVGGGLIATQEDLRDLLGIGQEF
jgi:hypothetical protein